MIVSMTEKHIEAVAGLHCSYVPGLLRDFGIRVCKAFYQDAIRKSSSLGFVFLDDAKVAGFVFGSEDNRHLFQGRRFYAELALAILRKPSRAVVLFRRKAQSMPTGPEASYVAVNPVYRGKRIAQRLFAKLYGELAQKGHERVLGYVDEDNPDSLHIQLKLGAKISREIVENGKKKFILDVPAKKFAQHG